MDKLTLVGFFVALVGVAGGFALEGGSLLTLLHLPAFIIVVGGTLGAVMIQTPMSQFKLGFQLLPWVVKGHSLPTDVMVDRLIEWSNAARAGGFLALENTALVEEDPFVHRGLNLLVDGVDSQVLQDTLDAELTLERERLLRGAKIFDAMGGYSPTIGIVGAVLGLIQAMSNITEPELLGLGIATAFVATIYGVGFANLIFVPIGNKLKNLIHQHTLHHELIVEGLVSISFGENPRTIERKLNAYRAG
ncbi:flagellar motor protein [Alkalimonas collagenimarina]|uniref:Flagellar motor protein n=1 Tax=Alkalimonas collagenimarina TaxID=400390 RepID=A0ABT9H2M5_9GAMM|nr:flagellar motor protein [Alkalimonas collagenimarina]MDP4537559.1 flagellar motor protein [Alkalimonas collagenimarina]